MNKKLGNILFVLAFLICQSGLSQYTWEPVFEHYSVEDGLPSTEVHKIYQDSKGYLWFATDMGVSRYDGYTFQNFSTADNLSDNTVFGFFEDKKERLWFRTYSGRLSYYYQDSIYQPIFNDSLSHSLDSRIISSICVDQNDTIWLGLSNGGEYGGGICKITPDNEIIYMDTISAFGQYIKVIENTGAIYGRFPQKVDLQYWEVGVKTPEDLTYRKHYIPKSYVLVYSSSYVNYINDFHFIWSYGKDVLVFQDNEVTDTLVADKSIITNMVDSKDNLWLGFNHKGGALKYKMDQLDTGKATAFLSGFSVTSVIEDRNGGLWFSTLENGVYHLINDNVLSLSIPDASGNSMTCIEGDHMGNVWVGSSDGIIYQIRDTSLRSHRADHLKEVNKSYVYNISYAGNGEIKVGSTARFFTLDGDRIKYPASDDKCLNNLKSLYLDVENDITIGGNNVGIHFFKNDKCFFHTRDEDTRTFAVTAIDKQNETTWLGSPIGLWKIEDKKLLFAGDKHNVLQGHILDLAKDGNDNLWIATKGDGIAVKCKNDLISFTKEDGLSSNFCNHIFFENDSTAWVSTNNGVNRLYFRNDCDISVSAVFTEKDGLVSNEVKGTYVFRDTVWVAGTRGLSMFNPKKMTSAAAVTPLYLNELRVNDREVDFSENTTFPYNDNNFSFSFTGLTFRKSSSTPYRYRLQNIEKNWIYTTKTNIRYPDLKYGKYVFQVQTPDTNGKWTESGIDYHFTIRPPFWLTWWFKAKSVLVLIGITYAFFRVRILTYNRDVVRELLVLFLKKVKHLPEGDLVLNEGNSVIRLNPEDILWVEASKNYIEIVTAGKRHLVRSSMKTIMEKLKIYSDDFCRVHRSYIVRTDRITYMPGSAQYLMIDQNKIPVGKTYKASALKIKEKIRLIDVLQPAES